MIGKSGERGSGISVLLARHDDDDDDENSNINSILLYCLVLILNQMRTFFYITNRNSRVSSVSSNIDIFLVFLLIISSLYFYSMRPDKDLVYYITNTNATVFLSQLLVK